MTLDEVKKKKKKKKQLTCQFETPDDILREFFEDG